MKIVLLKVGLFVVLIVAVFVTVGEALTGISGSGSGGGITGEVYDAVGQKIFFGKGKCYICHAFGAEGSAVRCPNLGVFGDQFSEPVGVRAASRRADEGMRATQYLVESLYDPNAYIVEGYPKDLMKPINRPPILLSDDEITSVISYLLVKSDVEMAEGTLPEILAAQEPYASGAVAVAEGGVEFEFPEGDPEEGMVVFAEMRCGKCHTVEGMVFNEEVEKGIGPDLTFIGSIQTRTYIVESILEPGKVILADPPGQKPGDEGSYRTEYGESKMPEFHDSMTLRQLLDIAAFLETLQGQEMDHESGQGDSVARWGGRR